MKAIVISIKPRFVADILNGKKTIEIRKSIPKCKLPMDVYIYCTKDKKYANLINRGGFLTGMVVAKFRLNKVEQIHSYLEPEQWYKTNDTSGSKLLEKSCLSFNELDNYLLSGWGWAWRIDDLVIFQRPRELKEFFVYSHSVAGVGIDGKDKTFEILKPLTKAPQSWCYIRDVL